MSSRKPSLLLALSVLTAVVSLIFASVRIWETDIQIILILGAILGATIAVFVLKMDYKFIEKSVINGIMTGMQSCLILYTVGILIGVWILSGVVPSMIYYGFMILSPSIFLFATLIICTISSLATGSSWGTSGTIGIALMGIASGLGIPAPVTAGIIISGGYCGDKLSPLSDTTNLAPAVAGADLFEHIKAMFYTTIPTYIIVAIITLVLGLKYGSGTIDMSKIEAMQMLMDKEFNISFITLLAPLSVLFLSAIKKPALPSLWVGIFVAVVIAFFNGTGIKEILGIMQNGYVPQLCAEIAKVADKAPELTATIAKYNLPISPESLSYASKSLVKLMERGGLQSMNWTVTLILAAFVFSAVMESCGYFEVILKSAVAKVKSTVGLITITLTSGVLCNIFFADQYLSIALAGRMYKQSFDDLGLHPRMLSRSLEDSATLTSALVPWNTCGAYQAGVLGVATFEYLPYAFFNYLNVFVAIIVTYFGFGIFWKGKNGESVRGGKSRPKELEN
ncbi:MAG: Na+/H+ antiporter NhaC [Synergistaceae bacterium]